MVALLRLISCDTLSKSNMPNAQEVPVAAAYISPWEQTMVFVALLSARSFQSVARNIVDLPIQHPLGSLYASSCNNGAYVLKSYFGSCTDT